MLQLTRRYLRQIDGIFLALCAACSVLSVVTLVSIGHNQLGSINKASVQFIASALGILLALIVSTVDYRALAHAWPLHAVLAWGMVLPTLLLHNVRLGFLTVGYDAGGTSNYSWYRVGGMTFQPAELAKISFVLTLALHLNHVRGRVNKPANLLALAVHVLLPVLAIHIQGDDGTALVFLGIGLVMVYRKMNQTVHRLLQCQASSFLLGLHNAGIRQMAAAATRIYTVRAAQLVWPPSSQAMISSFQMPTKPQFSPPTIASSRQIFERTELHMLENTPSYNGSMPMPCLLYTSPSPRDA